MHFWGGCVIMLHTADTVIGSAPLCEATNGCVLLLMCITAEAQQSSVRYARVIYIN